MTTCPSCGVPLPPDAPAGLCPACLARAARPARDEDGALDAETVAQMRRAFAESELELGELVGRGGMGFVFRARQKRLGREVAVKVLDPELSSNPLFAERFAREAQTLARLAHPHIVAVHDYGRSGELFYLVLEYVDGVNLRKVMRARTMAPEQALAIVPQICEALEFAHRLGIVHRDIKPENILLDRDGRVKIADFGLAKLCGVDVPPGSLTSTGQVLGTLRYMAPEQMDRPLEVDHRADIYSLGVVFYEMLTGEIPMGRFAPPSRKVRIDVRLDEVVLHTLEREPELRYQHAVEVKTDVEAIEAGKDPRSAAARPREIRRLSWLAVFSAVVAFGVPTFFSVMTVLAMGILARLPQKTASGSGGFFPTHVDSFSEGLLWVGPAFLNFIGMAIGPALGWAALERIRSRWPTLFGVGAAMSALWFLPLYALNCAVGFALFGTTVRALNTAPPVLIALFGAACIVFDVFWIARKRRRFLERLESEAEGRYQDVVEIKTDVEPLEAGKDARGTVRPREIRRLSWLAVLSVVVTFAQPFAVSISVAIAMGLAAFVDPPTDSGTSSGSSFTHSSPAELAWVYWVGVALFNLVGVAIGCALGWAALERIRARWPALFGVGAAMSALWFLPLYALNCAAGAVLFVATVRALNTVPVALIVVFGASCIAFDVRWIARKRRRFLERLENAEARM